MQGAKRLERRGKATPRRPRGPRERSERPEAWCGRRCSVRSEPGDRDLARDALRADLTRERFYFAMTDRFANGDPATTRAGCPATGWPPASTRRDKGFYQGGDLQGLIGKLDYIKGLGSTAIWMTPAFKNRPVQGTGANASAGYHGYWITDFTQRRPAPGHATPT